VTNSATQRIRLADIEATPWKNGGGVTREIATGARPDGASGWGWRVSLAEVAADGPFSIFPETDRVIAVIDGKGMDLLRPDGTTLALEPFQPIRFAGEEPFDGRLRDGPVRDLNVMVQRELFSAEMEIHQGPHNTRLEGGSDDFLLVHNLAGRCTFSLNGGAAEDLALAETLVHEGAGHFEVQIAESGRAAVIRVSPR
jgi:environmental stress-induced protein Ves